MVGFIFAKDVVVGMAALSVRWFPVDILAKQTRQRPSNCRFVLRGGMLQTEPSLRCFKPTTRLPWTFRHVVCRNHSGHIEIRQWQSVA